MSEIQTPSDMRQSDQHISRRNFFRVATAFALPTVLITAGCGQKGPLYLPETEEEKEEKSSG